MTILRTLVAIGAISTLNTACIQIRNKPPADITSANGGQNSGSNIIIFNDGVGDLNQYSLSQLVEKSNGATGANGTVINLEIAQRYLDTGNHGQAQVYVDKAGAFLGNDASQKITQLANARIAIGKGDYQRAIRQANPIIPTGLSAENAVRLKLVQAMVEGSEGKDQALNTLHTACLTPNRQMDKACWSSANDIALSFAKNGKNTNTPTDRTSLIIGQLMLANQQPYTLNYSNGSLFSQSSSDALERAMAHYTQSAPPVIGALLPISSRFSTVAKSTYKGMQASLELIPAGKRPRLVLIDIGDNPQTIATHIEQARKKGVTAFVGPLGTDYSNTIPPNAMASVRSHLVLSGQCTTAMQRGHCLKYSLSPESEASIIYRRLKEKGFAHSAILYSQNSWGERFRIALTGLSGGLGLNFIAFTTDTQDFSSIVRPIFQDPSIDSIVIAGVPAQARLIKPQITYFSSSRMQVIGTSTIYNGTQNAIQDTDLRGTQVPMLPIDDIDDPINTDIQVYAGQYWPDPSSDSTRFFALGFDTVLLTDKILNNLPLRGLEGRTGLLISDGLNVDRQLIWGIFSDGLVEKESTAVIE